MAFLTNGTSYWYQDLSKKHFAKPVAPKLRFLEKTTTNNNNKKEMNSTKY